MVSKFAFLSNLFFISVALAVPPSQLGARSHSGEDIQLQRSNTPASSVDITFNKRDGFLNIPTAGAMQTQPEGSFRSITGTFSAPSTIDSSHGLGVVFWLGIDAPSRCPASLRVGVQFRVKDGVIIVGAQYQWAPERSHNYPSASVKPNDIITLTTITPSNTLGLVVFRNLQSGWTHIKVLASDAHPLCLKDVVWMVEDIPPLLNFGRVTFYEASAIADGFSLSPEGATLMEIIENDQIRTTTSVDITIDRKVSLTVKYLPGGN